MAKTPGLTEFLELTLYKLRGNAVIRQQNGRRALWRSDGAFETIGIERRDNLMTSCLECTSLILISHIAGIRTISACRRKRRSPQAEHGEPLV
jgi:hypothetical protein